MYKQTATRKSKRQGPCAWALDVGVWDRRRILGVLDCLFLFLFLSFIPYSCQIFSVTKQPHVPVCIVALAL